MRLDDSSSRKSSLVAGELADLEAMRNAGSTKKSTIRLATSKCWDDCLYSLKIVRQKPRIIFISFLVFAILCGGGLGLVFFLAEDENQDEMGSALDLAVETGRWFGKFHLTIKSDLGTFSLTQFFFSS